MSAMAALKSLLKESHLLTRDRPSSSPRPASIPNIAFKYGRVVVRANCPVALAPGQRSGLWVKTSMKLAPTGRPRALATLLAGLWRDRYYGALGHNQNHISSAMHTPSSYGGTFNTAGQTISTASTAFHNYEMDWNSQRIIFSVDGVEHYTYAPAVKNSDTWPYRCRTVS